MVNKITTLFEFPTLPTTNDNPPYAHTVNVHNKIYKNLVAVESSFGGGDNGHLDILMPAGPYCTQADQDWFIPTPDPNLVSTYTLATEKGTKKKETQLFIRHKTDIKNAKTVTTLTCMMLLEALPEEYCMQLGDPTLGYNRVIPKEIIAHILCHYAKIDEVHLLAHCGLFKEPSKFSLPLDVLILSQAGGVSEVCG